MWRYLPDTSTKWRPEQLQGSKKQMKRQPTKWWLKKSSSAQFKSLDLIKTCSCGKYACDCINGNGVVKLKCTVKLCKVIRYHYSLPNWEI